MHNLHASSKRHVRPVALAILVTRGQLVSEWRKDLSRSPALPVTNFVVPLDVLEAVR